MKALTHQVQQISVISNNPHGYEAQIKGIFTCGVRTLVIPGFYQGGDTWSVHFSPPSLGTWEYEINDINQDTQLAQGVIECQEEGELLPLIVDDSHNRPLFATEKAPFMLCAYECNWLFALWMEKPEEAKILIEKLVKHRFNAVVINFYAHSCTWTKPETPGRLVPPPYCWGGSNESPDFSVLNEEFFTKMDEMFRYLQEKGLYIFAYFFVFNKNVNYPEKNSLEEARYVKYLTARYQAFPNISWIYAKESYHNPDKSNIISCLKMIRANDAYQRLLSNHDDRKMMYREDHQALTDYITLQHHQGFFDYTYRLVKEFNQPVFHAEFGYEPGSSLTDITYGVAQEIDEFIMRGWEVAFAGAGICYYYTYTGWDVIRAMDNPPGYAMFQVLHTFFQELDFWNYAPAFDVLLWGNLTLKHKTQDKYIIIANGNGNILADWNTDEYAFSGTWLDPFTGDTVRVSPKNYGPSGVNPVQPLFTNPFSQDRKHKKGILSLNVRKRNKDEETIGKYKK